MAGKLEGNVVLVFGSGNDGHRGVAVALAEAGADVAVAGVAPDLSSEAGLHSIANEIWAIGRRSIVLPLASEDAEAFAAAVTAVRGELGRADLVVRTEPA